MVLLLFPFLIYDAQMFDLFYTQGGYVGLRPTIRNYTQTLYDYF